MSTALAKKEPTGDGLAIVAPTSPMELLSIALNNNSGIDVIERLAALQEKAQARDAEVQFNDAMNLAQSELGRVAPDLNNPQTHSRYASYVALDRVLRPVYTKHGFSLSFDTGDAPADSVRVLCYVAHRGGHTRKYQVSMPTDGKGAKGGDVMTKTHATGAGMSYGMRYLLKFIFNVAIGENDTDGNGMKMGELSERLEWIENCKDLPELEKVFKAAYKEAHGIGDQRGMLALIAAKDKRRKELEG